MFLSLNTYPTAATICSGTAPLLKVRVPNQLSLNDCGPVSNTLLVVCGEVFISFRPGVYIQTFSDYIIVVIDMNY